MKKKNHISRLTVMAFLIALGVVISPILRFEGMCPMAHFINITCSVLLGHWYSLACAVIIGIIRMNVMGIPPLALTGAVFGAFLSGVFYRLSKGNLLFAVLGEVIGTGLIGALASYPVMTVFWGKSDISWLFYVPSFICGTLIGGSIAYIFLKKLARSGLLKKFQIMLGENAYDEQEDILGNAAAIAAFGVIVFVVVGVLTSLFKVNSPVFGTVGTVLMGVFIISGVIYYIANKIKIRKEGSGKA